MKMELFKEVVKENPNKNVFISPLSISVALRNLKYGACGKTIKEISSVLEDDEFTLDNIVLYDKIYGDSNLDVEESYVKKVEDKFEKVNFRRDHEKLISSINNAVENTTNGKIKDIISDISYNTRLLIVNAVYFKATWVNKFVKYNNTIEKFWIDHSQYKNVEMMFNNDYYKHVYIDDIKSSFIEIPYDMDYSMIILLPDNILGSEEVEKKLSNKSLIQWYNKATMKDVDLSIPKMSLSESYRLNTCLSNLGVNIFDSSSNFKNISKSSDLYVSDFYHKTFVDINEDGTEAAAASALLLKDCCASKSIRFNADHPFIFLIKHNKSFSIVFMGKFCTP
ncbi:serine protease inhibitor-like SPI-1 [Brazilian porcupinepox virus 1]|nr:serine protease inhibitor-like SPI-1 [Brazilian porcupinepox virus 1]